MSGVKSIRIEPSARERAELARAAARREKEEAAAARRALEERAEALRGEIEKAKASGIAVIPAAAAQLVWPAERFEEVFLEELHARGARLARVSALVARARHLADALGEAHPAARKALSEAIGRAFEESALEAALAAWLGQTAALAPIEATLRGAARATSLVAACEALRIPLDAELSGAASAVSSFSTNPTLAGVPGAEAAIVALSSSHLGRAIAARRRRLARALERAAEPSMEAELGAFRAGLPEDLQKMREQLEADGFGLDTRPLEALDAFLRARAEARVVLVCQSGIATGRRATPLRFDPLRRAVVATLEDEHGVFARIAETVVDWAALGGDEGDFVEMKGPAEWDGPACVHGGHGDVLRALRAQGVPATLYGEDGAELFPGDAELVLVEVAGERASRGFS